MNQQSNTTEGTTITIERVFDAPVSEVWDAFTNPDKLVQWWGPHQYGTRDWTIDLQVGGKFRYCMVALDGSEEHWCYGVYDIVTPDKRLAHSAIVENPAGSENPIMAETYVDIEFFDEDGKTRIHAIQSGIPEASWASGVKAGWAQQSEKLDTFLASN